MPRKAEQVVHGSNGFTATGLAATPTASDAGTDVVAVWAGADVSIGDRPVAEWVTRVSTAAAGTSWKFTERGNYQVDVVCDIAASATVVGGIYLDATTERATDPTLADVACRARSSIITPAATRTALVMSVVLPITQSMADGITGILTVALGDASGAGAVAAEFLLTECRITVFRVSDNNSRA